MIAWLAILACSDKSSGEGADSANDDADADVDTDTDADSDTDPPDPETVALAGPCPLDQRIGNFAVASDAFLTTAAGAVANGVVPLTVLDNEATEGDCTLLRRVSPFCDPACAPDETCSLDEECIPYPTQQDVGTVSITGLYASVVMEPSTPGYNYYLLGLPHPAYAPGDLVTLDVEGAYFPGFRLYGVGLVPLELVPGQWVLSETEDMAVAWGAPGGPVRSTVHLRVTIDQHGVSPIQLDCDFADTGSGTVPAGIAAQLVASGVTGFPSATLTRWTVDSTSVGPGCVDFALSWSGLGDLRVEGYTPCGESADCPSGQTCNTVLEICE
jgi:hypothetical protein